MYAYHVLTCFKFVAPKVWSIFGFFEPDMNTELGVVIYMYLKHSPDYIDSKYIYLYIYIYIYRFMVKLLRFKCFCWNTIFGIFRITQEKIKVWPGGTQLMLLQEWSRICIPSFRSVAPRVCCGKNTIFGFFSLLW